MGIMESVRPWQMVLVGWLTLTLAVMGCRSGAEQEPPRSIDAFDIALAADWTTATLIFIPGTDLYESRGVGWRVERWTGEGWSIGWLIAGEVFTVAEWADGNHGVGSVGVFGPGPDITKLPDLDPGKTFRICHGIERPTSPSGCALIPHQPSETTFTTTTTDFQTTIAPAQD